MQSLLKSSKLANVCYDIRGPVLEKARQMEEEGQHIIKLNIGNIAAFGLEPPDEIVQDMIRNLPNAAGYTDSKGLFAPRKAIVHYTQQKHVKGVTVDDVFLGNGASELIAMSMNALLNDGDEVLIPAPDYPLWTASVALSGGTPVHYLCDEANDWLPDLDDMAAQDHAAHARRRRHQPEQPDRRALSRRAARQDRRARAPARPDRLRRRDLRQDALRRPHAHLASRRSPTTCCSSPSTACRRTTARAATAPAGWSSRARSATPRDYIEGLNMLASMRLCSNTPGQLAIQTALGGYQSIDDLVAPGGRLRAPARPRARAADRDPGRHLRQAEGGALHVPEARSEALSDRRRPAVRLRAARRAEGADRPGHRLQLGQRPTTCASSSCPTPTTSPKRWAASRRFLDHYRTRHAR